MGFFDWDVGLILLPGEEQDRIAGSLHAASDKICHRFEVSLTSAIETMEKSLGLCSPIPYNGYRIM